MSGKIKGIIDSFIERQAENNSMMRDIIEAYMMLNGINPHEYTPQSEDDPAIMGKLEEILQEIEAIMSSCIESDYRQSGQPALN